ncbi:MAG: putative photosynthetic complex assembly protein PuhE [Pseudomonadota bacterium]
MAYVWPVLIAVSLWWLATLGLLWRIGLPRTTFRASLWAVTAAMVIGVGCIIASASMATPLGAYLAFVGTLGVWCWHEATYFFGSISGPRPLPCPAGVTLWQRFCYGVGVSLYHELLVVLTALLLWALLKDAANPVALQAFVVLWLMRWSTKINIFFGVSNLHTEYWPSHLQYLDSYAGAANTNRFFPLSIALGVALTVWLVQPWLGFANTAFDVVSVSLLLTLLVLGLLEHLFLLVPVPDGKLWSLAVQTPTKDLSVEDTHFRNVHKHRRPR